MVDVNMKIRFHKSLPFVSFSYLIHKSNCESDTYHLRLMLLCMV